MPEALPTGGCMCGAVRFELTASPVRAGYCHCVRCQRRTGTAASPVALVAPGTVKVTAGAERIEGWRAQDGMEKCFCATCGAHLFSRHPGGGEVAAVRMGAFDGDPGVPFSFRQFTDYAASWEPIPDDGLPRFPERRPPDA